MEPYKFCFDFFHCIGSMVDLMIVFWSLDDRSLLKSSFVNSILISPGLIVI